MNKVKNDALELFNSLNNSDDSVNRSIVALNIIQFIHYLDGAMSLNKRKTVSMTELYELYIRYVSNLDEKQLSLIIGK